MARSNTKSTCGTATRSSSRDLVSFNTDIPLIIHHLWISRKRRVYKPYRGPCKYIFPPKGYTYSLHRSILPLNEVNRGTLKGSFYTFEWSEYSQGPCKDLFGELFREHIGCIAWVLHCYRFLSSCLPCGFLQFWLSRTTTPFSASRLKSPASCGPLFSLGVEMANIDIVMIWVLTTALIVAMLILI